MQTNASWDRDSSIREQKSNGSQCRRHHFILPMIDNPRDNIKRSLGETIICHAVTGPHDLYTCNDISRCAWTRSGKVWRGTIARGETLIIKLITTEDKVSGSTCEAHSVGRGHSNLWLKWVVWYRKERVKDIPRVTKTTCRAPLVQHKPLVFSNSDHTYYFVADTRCVICCIVVGIENIVWMRMPCQ